MKKLLVLGSAVALSSAAYADVTIKAPTISGRINNELRYITQSDKTGEPGEGTDNYTGAAEVKNAPSYIKAAGNIPMNNMFNLDYVIELGAGIEFGTSVRQSVVTLNSKFGHLVLGHTYTPGSMIGMYDPLWATGAGLGGSDFGKIENFQMHESNYTSSVDGIGFRHNLRKDIVGYKSPKFMGAQLFVSHDRDNDEDIDSASKPGSRTDAVLSYGGEFGGLKLNAMVNYETFTGSTINNQEKMAAALKVGMHGFNIAGGYTTSTWDVKHAVSGDMKEAEKTQMFAALSYKMNAHLVALTYAQKEFENNSLATKKESEESQLTLGYEHGFNKYVTGTLTGSMLTIEDTTAATTEKKNEATQIATGLRVVF